MPQVPDAVLLAVQLDEDAAFDVLMADEGCCFSVDWREEDDAIVDLCESVLETGRLAAEWVGDGLFITFGEVRRQVPLTFSEADRHVTLLTLSEVLRPEYEVRMLYASVGSDTGSFLPMASGAWAELEAGWPEVVPRRFHKLSEFPNTFTDPVEVPTRPGGRG